MRAVKNGCKMLVNLKGRNCLGGLTLGTSVILKLIFKKEGIRHLTSLSRTFCTVPVGAEGLQRAFHLCRSPSYSSYSFPFSSPFRQNPLSSFFPSVLWVCSPIFWLANQFWGISHPLLAQRAQTIIMFMKG